MVNRLKYHRNQSRQQRVGEKYFRKVAAVILVLMVMSIALVAFQTATSFRNQPFISLMAVSNPVTLWFIDLYSGNTTIITLPDSVYIKSVSGYGEYSLSGLYRLDNLEGKGGQLLSKSLEVSLGLPVSSFFVPLPDRKHAGKETIADFLSLATVKDIILGQVKTDLDMFGFLKIYLLKYQYPLQLSHEVNLDGTLAIKSDKLADGTKIRYLDTDALNLVFGQYFQDDDVRSESLNLMIYNTTDAPALGKKAAFILERYGIKVIGLENKKTANPGCILEMPEKYLNTKTYRFISYFFKCEEKYTVAVNRWDMALYLGREYAVKFRD